MRSLGMAMVGLALLAGCADKNSLGEYEKQLNTLVGQSEADLTRRMGTPTSVNEAGGQRTLVYYLDWPGWAGKQGGVPGPDRYCRLSFPIQNGKVASYAVRGQACGWDGYPMIKPS